MNSDNCTVITSDPNRPDDPEYIVRLLGKVVTVSLATIDCPPAKVSPCLVSPREGNRDLGHADDAGSYSFAAAGAQEAPRGSCPAGPMLSHQVEKERRVGYHLGAS